MRPAFRNRLVFKLIFQIVIVILIISLGFAFLSMRQAREMQKRVLDKAELYSFILGANLDKILTDNLTAYSELHNATVQAAGSQNALERLRVITKGHVIVSSSVESEVWTAVDKKYHSMVDEAIRTGKAKSLTQSGMGKKTVIHFLPVGISQDQEGQTVGVIQINAWFPSEQKRLIASVRTDSEVYFWKEANQIARELAARLNVFLAETHRNFGYLQRLIDNMKTDEELDDIKIFSRDLGVLFSGEGMVPVQFSARETSRLQAEAMEQQRIVFAQEKANAGELLIAGPLYLYKGQQKVVSGAVELAFSLKRLKAQISKGRNNILLMNLLIALTFSLLIGWFFKRRIFTPIKELTSLTERIKRDDFSQRAQFKANDEFGWLVEDFNSMMDELDRSKKEIGQWNLRLQEKVEDVTAELKKKQKQLLETEKLASLGILSGGIAHEINNPLGIILGQTQLLLRNVQKRGPSTRQQSDAKVLEEIEENVRRCSYIVKSLLQFTKTKTPHLVDTDIHAAIDHALGVTSSRRMEKGIKIVQQRLEKTLYVKADPLQIGQVFINVLTNAQQAMDEGGEIHIATSIEESPKGSQVCIVFRDDGRGVAPRDLAKVFDPFFSTKDPGEGVGLGLSVSYGIIKAHDGQIEITSKPGDGTQVIIKLPL